MLLTIGTASANEVPEDRSIYVFGPFYYEFRDQGEDALYQRIHYYHNYYFFSQIEENAPAPSPTQTSLDGFLNQLKRTSGKWGIILIDSHGDEDGWLAVESFPDTPAGIAAQGAAQQYYGLPDTVLLEGDPEGGFRTLLLSPDYVAQFSPNLGKKSIVFGNFCYSAYWIDAILSGGQAYNHLGYSTKVYPDFAFQTANTWFGRLGGALEEKRNYTVEEAAIGFTTNVWLDSLNSAAQREVVYNSPKILELKVTQVGRVVYDYKLELIGIVWVPSRKSASILVN